MLEYCEEHHIPYERCGKLIVAISQEELGPLQGLHDRARANGVEGVVRLDEQGLREIEPEAVGVAALHVPTTAIVDFRMVAEAIASDLSSMGSETRLHSRVLGIRAHGDRASVRTTSGVIECGRVIACAGLGSDAIARQVGGSDDIHIVPFRGDYYRLAPEKRALLRGLIYPVPDPRFPFLGVHLTKRIDGDVWLGPNAVLALGLEAYRRTDINLLETLAIFRYAGFRTMATRYWRTGLSEMVRDYSKRRFLAGLRKYVPALNVAHLLPGPSGIRAQAVKKDGTLIDDFWFEKLGPVVLVRNAPSPAATASLAIAREIADQALGAA
jgi:L-2-hydroxyglutarate oxidase LhgO